MATFSDLRSSETCNSDITKRNMRHAAAISMYRLQYVPPQSANSQRETLRLTDDEKAQLRELGSAPEKTDTQITTPLAQMMAEKRMEHIKAVVLKSQERVQNEDTQFEREVSAAEEILAI